MEAAHGVAGPLLALLAHDAATGVDDPTTMDYLSYLVERTPALSAAAAAPGASTLAVSWCQGPLGIARVLVQGFLIRRDETLLDLAQVVADDSLTRLYSLPTLGQCCGVAGIGDLLLDLVDAGRDHNRAAVEHVARYLVLRAGGTDQHPIFRAPTKDTHTASWARGGAGILGFFRRLTAGGPPTLPMLDLSAASIWRG